MKQLLPIIYVVLLALSSGIQAQESGTQNLLNCPETINQTTDQGQCGATVSYIVDDTITEIFEYTGSVNTFTVPPGVTSLNISAFGAEGGSSSMASGGLGAHIVGDLAVTPGQVLQILVGQKGTDGGNFAGGGGGGSFVILGNDVATGTLLIAAGGGGGRGAGFAGGSQNPGGLGGDGQLTENGGAAIGGECNPCSGTAGTNGNGATGGDSFGGLGGGGGAGLLTNGGDRSGGALGATGGQAIINGGAGGATLTNDGIPGGFGGGGAGGSSSAAGGGGGGGYSGGAGGGQGGVVGSGGGGGGSFNSGTNQVNTAGVRSGDGEIIITYNAILTQTAGLPNNSYFPIGETINTFETIDGSGNTISCSFSVIITDDEDPILTVPADILQDTTNDTCGAIVNYSVSGTDNCASGEIIFTASGTVETFTVPPGVTSLNISAFGAEGGSSSMASGGLGAHIVGDLAVTPGQVLQIMVGQKGTDGGNFAGGGGGGSFVILGNDVATGTLLIAAGGGGGRGAGFAGGSQNPGGLGGDGQLTENGGAAIGGECNPCSGTAGTNGNGATGGDSFGGLGGGGGAGLLTNGGDRSGGALGATGGQAIINGGAGGATLTNDGIPGGFGGGGAGGSSSAAGGGGGGGYSGGAGGGQGGVVGSGGGGGGSFNSGTNQVNTAGVRSGDGEIIITYEISPIQTAGLPSGSEFPVGTTTNTFTLTDTSGNSITQSFDVVITDNQDPTINCPADFTVNAASNGTYTIEDYTSIASDNCTAEDNLIITQNPIAGSVVNTGVTAVTVNVEDASGNISECTFEITVDASLGIEDGYLNNNTVNVYPNPSNNVININIENSTIDSVALFDLSGRQIKSFNTQSNNNVQISLQDVSTGTYLLKIVSGSEQITKQIVRKD
ncbi:hypothetical protein BWZ20_06405 [Winogradskyella sp. J14-2]|uniref:HYR domain-containing protein n=1 Tax=Winogradskyella sp. J14-2 TaxID=1936080 RepID=UPI000972B4D2|nr:HYR domain-containing protein [Winogradskyella sp. J14-2]APY07957.1 hypothetical protein BWZ20_06405 [Winogradskyella sp. J14-2]